MVRCSLLGAYPVWGVNACFTVCLDVNESNVYRDTHILINDCLGKTVKVLRAFLSDEVNHVRAHSNMHDVQCVVKVISVVLENTDVGVEYSPSPPPCWSGIHDRPFEPFTPCRLLKIYQHPS